MIITLAFVVTFIFDAVVLYLLKNKYPFGKPSSFYKKAEYVIGVLILMVISFAVIRASLTYISR